MNLKRAFSEWWPLAKKAVSSWVADYAPSMGAALSYYTVFSLAPILLIVISIAGLIFGEEAARGALFGELGQPDGCRCGQGRRGPAGQCQQAVARHPRHGGRRRGAAGRRDDRLRRTAGCARSHLARAGAPGQRPVEPAAHTLPLVRDDPRRRVPADGVAGRQHGDLGAGQVVGAGLRRVRGLVARGHLRLRLRRHHGDLRGDLQGDAARAGALARRLGRRGGHVAALRHRPLPDRAVHRQERRGFRVRRRWLDRDHLPVGLLLRADLPDGGRVHLGLCAHVRFDEARGGRGCHGGASDRRACRRRCGGRCASRESPGRHRAGADALADARGPRAPAVGRR